VDGRAGTRHVPTPGGCHCGGVLSRRRVLSVGAASAAGVLVGGVAAVEAGLLPGRVQLARALGRCAGPAAPPAPGPPVRAAQLASGHRGRPVRWQLALPPGVPADGLPVVLVLHGRGDDAGTAFRDLGLHVLLARNVAAGGRPFALAAADGGEGYWHPRADGDDPLGMLVNELLPTLGGLGLDVRRIGVWGWSMGGFGALLVARESARGGLGAARVVVAGAASPALFDSYADAAPGAFDDPADFDRWGTLIADPAVDASTALRVTCGDADAFTDPTRRYRAAVTPTPAGDIAPGCHDTGYWATEAPAALSFLADHLAP
jgi:poly(3-hydroxybutyrate) depolymerase